MVELNLWLFLHTQPIRGGGTYRLCCGVKFLHKTSPTLHFSGYQGPNSFEQHVITIVLYLIHLEVKQHSAFLSCNERSMRNVNYLGWKKWIIRRCGADGLRTFAALV